MNQQTCGIRLGRSYLQVNNKVNFPENRFEIFETLIKVNFLFLIELYNFKLTKVKKQESHCISARYQSEDVFVEIYYGAPSFELDFIFGREDIENHFTSQDLTLLSDDDWSNYKLYSAHSYENLTACIPRLADLLKSLGRGCLLGNDTDYQKLISKKKRKQDTWYDDLKLVQAKEVALKAWKERDFAKVVESFSSVYGLLSPSEIKKLEYARKRILNRSGAQGRT